MAKEFIQVSATKSNGDFMICSNLSLFDQCLSPAEAFARLVKLAQEYVSEGYDVKWTREPLSELELEVYSDVFDGE